MASNSHGRGTRDDNPSADPSIPLQDLSGPLERGTEGQVGSRFFPGRASTRGSRPTRDYERLAEDSPVDNVAAAGYPRGQGTHADDMFVDDPGAFAMASAGLSFGDMPTINLPEPHSHNRSESDLGAGTMDEFEGHYLTPTVTYNDTAPLTTISNVQPISGAQGESSSSSLIEQHDFSLNERPSGSRLGDDLESGFRGRRSRGNSSAGEGSRRLSPSPSGSALQRASSMMKSMSQRIVNLSNEPEVVEQSILREESQKNARLEAPPELPDLPGYAHDAPSTPSLNGQLPNQKAKSWKTIWRQVNNPLRGKALGLLGPDNAIRVRLCDILVHPFTEPFILIVIIIQLILLTIESARSVWKYPREWGKNPMDYPYFAIFIIYTLELVAKILVSGLIINPSEYSTIDRSLGFRKAVVEKGKNLIAPQRNFSTKKVSVMPDQQQASIIRTFTGGLNQLDAELVDDPLQKRRVRLAHRAFLRHSFNRLDFVAVVAYWIAFFLAIVGVETRQQLYVFRMLSCLRILRLLALTNGTSIILRSLKKAAPLLVHVAFLIGFFWLLFAIIGIQSFKSSLGRTCTWIGIDGQQDYPLNDPSGNVQFCGGYINSTGHEAPWIRRNGIHNEGSPKGYLCPQGSQCIEGDNPYNGTVSFDNIVQSLELVFVIMSSNTFTDLLYYTTDSDYLATALFFACGFVILSLWLVNLLVAVITHSFQVIREESKRSAFAVQNIDGVDKEDQGARKISTLKRIYDKTEWFWVVVILFDLIVQALRSSSMSPDRGDFINTTETVVTLVLLVEIILRFVSDWRRFHRKRRNWFDLGLAIITCIIQIPAIKGSERAYSVLTLFQILRVYRVVLAFSVTKNLIMVVFRNAIGLLNLIVFVFLMTFLASIFATQLFRSQIPEQDAEGELVEINFADIYNSFIGMYQILSSENWTSILYTATTYTTGYGTAWISATFIILWFVVANFIILNMFIAVIQESFDVSEDEKRLQQVRAFLEQKQVSASSQGNLALSKILMFGRDSDRYRDPLDHGPAALDMLLKDAVVREFLDEEVEEEESETARQNHRRESVPLDTTTTAETAQPGVFSRAWNKISTSIMRREPNPFYSKLKFSRAHDELDPRAMAREVVSAAEQRKRAQREYLMRHPNYNKSLFLFAPDNSIRRLCQRIVGPGRGHQRVEGVDPYKPIWYTFSAFIYAAIVAMVLLACITTPIYQRKYFHTGEIWWFTWTDMGFAVLFTVEALIKVVADGFFWTPNAYFRSSWGFIDGIVLITLWISVISSLYRDWGISRAIGAFKALRALRLLNVSDSAKNTFHSVIILGGWKVIAAAAVSMSFLMPFAIYGINLFNGQMVQCNDGSIEGSLDACISEYNSTPFNWEVLAPRAASNPFYDFDNFGNSLFILFQIVSQEGWTDVQASAMSITGKNQQPQDFVAPENGLFFIVFNLLGAVFVLTLFVSVFMRNYTEQTGVAFLTAEQRSWLELRKLLRQISPSKRSFDNKSQKWRVRCYRIAVKKHGRWARCVSIILVLHLLMLVLEFYPEPKTWETVRGILFFAFNFFYIANVVIRMLGLGWHRFSRSSWDIFSLIVVPGAFITTVLNMVQNIDHAIAELNKLFLVAITLLLIPRNNQLDQLFKTAAASLTAIGNLLATWFVLFLVYAIAMNQAFGLTKFGDEGNNNINFRDIPRSLILLFRLSCGEGWNQVMEDFATMEAPLCTDDSMYGDCGSAAWARPLFISWNLISMYIFVSLFVSLIFESFSYVYQRSSGLYVISREEIRRFKQAWATYDPDGSGYISKEQFPRLLGELSGVFSMRVYDDEFSIRGILDECRVDKRDSLLSHRRVVDGVDLDKMSKILRRLPVEEIRTRRQRLNTFYEEVLVTADPVRGISFHYCLMILAHYNVISDSKSLRLEEFLRRRARLQRVEEAVRRNTVRGFFDTLYWARQFRRKVEHKKSARMSFVPQFTVPEIFVDDETQDDIPQEERRRMAQEALVGAEVGEPSRSGLSPTSPTRGEAGSSLQRSQLPRIDTNLASGASSPTEWSSISLSLSPGRARANTTSSYGTGPDVHDEIQAASDHSRQNSAMSVQEVMQSLDDSAWGESLRRSFTQRRRSDT